MRNSVTVNAWTTSIGVTVNAWKSYSIHSSLWTAVLVGVTVNAYLTCPSFVHA